MDSILESSGSVKEQVGKIAGSQSGADRNVGADNDGSAGGSSSSRQPLFPNEEKEDSEFDFVPEVKAAHSGSSVSEMVRTTYALFRLYYLVSIFIR